MDDIEFIMYMAKYDIFSHLTHTFSNSATRLSILSSDNFPTSNMVTAWVFKPGDRFPIIRYAVSLESNKNAIFFLWWDDELMFELVDAEDRLNVPVSLSGNTKSVSVSFP